MAGYEHRRCPICHTQPTVPHCRSPLCVWRRCPREACKARVSFGRGRGFLVLPGDVVKTFAFDLPNPPPGG